MTYDAARPAAFFDEYGEREVRWEIDLCAEPGAVASGPHIVVVARTPS